MKKTKIIAATLGLCMAAALFAGCNQPSSGETAQAVRLDGGQTQISVEASNQSESGNVEGYAFTYRGYSIMPGANAESVLAALGDPIEEPYQAASCAGQGLDTTYTYAGFLIQTYTDNGVELIRGIIVEDPLTDCNGVRVGQTVDEAKAVFGTPEQVDDYGLLYISGNTALQISTDGVNTIESIVYRTAD